MPCTKPGWTMNTSGPTTPSRIDATSARRSLTSTARAALRRSRIDTPSAEVVAEAHAAPARPSVGLLVEAERAREVECVREVFLVGRVVQERRDLPRVRIVRV